MESTTSPLIVDEIRERIGKSILKLRLKKGDNQADTAYGARLQPYYISQIENGKRMPTIETLIKLANYFEVSLSAIIE